MLLLLVVVVLVIMCMMFILTLLGVPGLFSFGKKEAAPDALLKETFVPPTLRRTALQLQVMVQA